MIWLLSFIALVIVVLVFRRGVFDSSNSELETSRKMSTRRSSSRFDNDLFEVRNKQTSLAETQLTGSSQNSKNGPESREAAKNGLYGMKGLSSGDYLNANNKLKRPF